jgi:large subunit ribosomal protein L18
MTKAQRKVESLKRRAFRVRKKISGTAERPRLCVNKSLIHMSAQIVDDVSGKALVQVTSASKEVAGILSKSEKKATKSDISKVVGQLVAEKAIVKGIKKVVFDRKGYAYHGRVKALADAARSKGLVF